MGFGPQSAGPQRTSEDLHVTTAPWRLPRVGLHEEAILACEVNSLDIFSYSASDSLGLLSGAYPLLSEAHPVFCQVVQDRCHFVPAALPRRVHTRKPPTYLQSASSRALRIACWMQVLLHHTQAPCTVQGGDVQLCEGREGSSKDPKAPKAT